MFSYFIKKKIPYIKWEALLEDLNSLQSDYWLEAQNAIELNNTQQAKYRLKDLSYAINDIIKRIEGLAYYLEMEKDEKM